MAEIDQRRCPRIGFGSGGWRNLGTDVMAVGRGVFEEIRLFESPESNRVFIRGFLRQQQFLLFERAARETYIIDQSVPNQMLLRVTPANHHGQIGLMIRRHTMRDMRSAKGSARR